MNPINSRLNLISFESYPMCSENRRARCQRKCIYHSVLEPIKTLLTAKKEKNELEIFSSYIVLFMVCVFVKPALLLGFFFFCVNARKTFLF